MNGFTPQYSKYIFHVEGRMKVEDGGKRGVTQPFWLRIGFCPPRQSVKLCELAWDVGVSKP